MVTGMTTTAVLKLSKLVQDGMMSMVITTISGVRIIGMLGTAASIPLHLRNLATGL